MHTSDEINVWFTENWKRLLEVAYNQLIKIKRTDLSDTLVTDCYMYINDNLEKLQPALKEGLLEAIVVNWMNKQIVWRNTKFKKQWVYSDVYDYDIEEVIPDEADDFDLEAEMEWMDKIEWLESTIAALGPVKKKIWDLAIVGEYNNSGKLSRFLKLNRTTCYYMIRNLKDEINEMWDARIDK